ncbi:MFS transporter [Thermoproteota archaeon]
MKYYFVIYLCNFLDLTIGAGIFPLLPVYAAQFGAKPGLIGIYLACANFAIALGSIFGGWLSDHVQKRKLLYILCTLSDIPLFFLAGRVTSIVQLIVITAILWFTGGIKLTVLSTLLGLYAKKSKRRQAFLILTITTALGVIVGGLTFGPIADKWSYTQLFNIISVSFIVLLVIAFFLREINVKKISVKSSINLVSKKFSKNFYILILINTIIWVAAEISFVGRSIIMNTLNFSSTDISHTGAIGAIVSIPILLILNRVIRHFSHKKLLVLALFIEVIFLIILGNSWILWHFWAVSILMGIFDNLTRATGQALVTDIIPKQSFGKGLAFLASSMWIGFAFGALIIGFGIEKYGLTYPFYFSVLLPIVAFIILLRLKTELPHLLPPLLKSNKESI